VNDLVPPAFFCNPQTITLSATDSTGFVVPEAFLLDPFLECCEDTLLIEDLDNPGMRTDTLFLDYDDFLDAEAQGGITIEVFAIDCYGNQSSCVTKIFILEPVAPPGFSSIQGAIFTEDDEYLPEIQVNLDGGQSNTVMTNSDGNYAFADVPEGLSYFIQPFHNQDPLNGVSTWDIVLLQKHVLGVTPLSSPYKMIAADVNRSGHVSTLDIVEVRKLILGITPTFQNNSSWRFVDYNYVFPNSDNPFESSFPEHCIVDALEEGMLDMNFVGVKVGDVNNSAEMNVGQGIIDERQLKAFHFNTLDQFFAEGETLVVPVRAKDFKQIGGFQFSMTFDQEYLSFAGLGAVNLPGLKVDNFGFNFIENGLLTCSWVAMDRSDKRDNEVLFELKFKTQNAGRLSKVLALNSRYTKAELYRANGSVEHLDLQFGDQVEVAALGFELFQNQPNPFAERTLLSFSLEASSAVILTIFDASGKVAWQHQEQYAKGVHEILVHKDELPGNGLYFYQLKTPTGTATKRMVVAGLD